MCKREVNNKETELDCTKARLAVYICTSNSAGDVWGAEREHLVGV